MAVGTADYTMKNLNEKTNEEIEGFLKKSKEELFNLRFQSATGQLENTARLQGGQARHRQGCTPSCASVSSASARPLRRPKRKLREVMAEERNFRKVRRGYVVSDIRWTRRFPSSSSSVRPTRCTARSCVPLVRSRSMMNTTRPALATS